MTKKTETPVEPLPAEEPPKRLFKNVGDLPILWKHDTPDQRYVMPGEVIDFDHLTDGEIDLLIGQGFIAPVTLDDIVPQAFGVLLGKLHAPP